jgi:predicted GNAT family acetyltransferase
LVAQFGACGVLVCDERVDAVGQQPEGLRQRRDLAGSAGNVGSLERLALRELERASRGALEGLDEAASDQLAGDYRQHNESDAGADQNEYPLDSAIAARNRTAAGVARVAPVYTPPEQRRHGYGTAVTAACTRDALGQDAEHVVLFTDLANPTSNAIYQQIGYRPVRDQQVIHFVA